MSLSATKLRSRLKAAGVSKGDLASAVERDGLRGDRARAAIDHWLKGSKTRECKGHDINQIAQTLSCQPGQLRRYIGEFRFARIAPRKAQLVVDMIRGMDYVEAWALLEMCKKRAAMFVSKALETAVSNAEDSNQGGLDRRSLTIVEARVSPGPTIKRFQPKDRGRAHPILKRNCHITIAVEER